MIGKPRDEVSALAAGLNHFTWIYDLRHTGADAWPLVREIVAADKAAAAGQVLETGAPGGETTLLPDGWRGQVAHNPFSWSLFEAYGAYPSANDRHVVEFFPERFPRGNYHGKTLGVDVFPLEQTIAYGDEIYGRMRAQALGETPLDEGIFERTLGEHSQFPEIMDSIEGDKRRVYSANLPNNGAVPNLPADAILELSAVATGRGLRAIHVPDLSQTLAAPLVRKISAQALTVKAALTGSRELFVEALLADGSVSDRATAEKLADELLAAHAQYLPQFA
jgi:alpha-galactosidase